MADGTGHIVIADEFESEPTAAVGGFFAVYTDNGIDLRRAAAPFTQLEGCTGLRYAGAFVDGLAPVCRPDGPIEVVDSTGTVRFSLSDIDGHNFTACMPFFTHGVLPVREAGTGLWGAVNTEGHVAVNPAYETMTQFNCGYALATRTDASGTSTLVVLTPDGKEHDTVSGSYEPEAPFFTYGHIPVRSTADAIQYMLSTGGNLRAIPDGVKRALLPVEDGFVFLAPDGRCGTMNYNGETMMKPEYFSIHAMPGTDRVWCESADGVSVRLTDGIAEAELPGIRSLTALPHSGTYLAVRISDNKTLLLDSKFTPIAGTEFAEASLRITLSDIILSDRDADHKEFNNDAPAEDYPEWMTPDDETEQE